MRMYFLLFTQIGLKYLYITMLDIYYSNLYMCVCVRLRLCVCMHLRLRFESHRLP